MNLLVSKEGFTLCGKIKDLKDLFTHWPASMTLLDFIRLNTH